jgi:hypothetical protein
MEIVDQMEDTSMLSDMLKTFAYKGLSAKSIFENLKSILDGELLSELQVVINTSEINNHLAVNQNLTFIFNTMAPNLINRKQAWLHWLTHFSNMLRGIIAFLNAYYTDEPAIQT